MYCAIADCLNFSTDSYRAYFSERYGVPWSHWTGDSIRIFLAKPGVITMSMYTQYLTAVWREALFSIITDQPNDQMADWKNRFISLWATRRAILEAGTRVQNSNAARLAILTAMKDIKTAMTKLQFRTSHQWLLYNVGTFDESFPDQDASADETQLANFRVLLSRPGWQLIGDEAQLQNIIVPVFGVTALVLTSQNNSQPDPHCTYRKAETDFYIMLLHKSPDQHWEAVGLDVPGKGAQLFFTASDLADPNKSNIRQVFSDRCHKDILSAP